MTSTPTPTPGSRGSNPFQSVPMPIPLKGWNLRAADIFREGPLADRLERNAGWLQARPRTSNQIQDALFPSFDLGGMQSGEVRALLNRALWDAGFTPDHEDANPTWTWTDGN